MRPEQLWAFDIIHPETIKEGNTYLHPATDACSKQIMGYELCNNPEAVLTLKELGFSERLENIKQAKEPVS